MAKPFVSYEVENDKEFQAAIDKAIKQVGSLRSPFKLITKDFYKSERAIFKLKGPGEYDDLKEKTKKTKIKSKISRGAKPYPILLRTGKLMRSLINPKGAGALYEINDTSLTIGTSITHGIYHQSDDARDKIPQRKFLWIGPEGNTQKVPKGTGRLERWTGYIKLHVDKKLGIK